VLLPPDARLRKRVRPGWTGSRQVTIEPLFGQDNFNLAIRRNAAGQAKGGPAVR
jgi:hypothetical protein